MASVGLNFVNSLTQPGMPPYILIYLQPVNPQNDYLFASWDSLNPAPGTKASTILDYNYSAAISVFGSTDSYWTSPASLNLGNGYQVINPNDQSPFINPTPSTSVPATPQQVVLANACTGNVSSLPPRVTLDWYVNGNLTVQTNTTEQTALSSGVATSFQLTPSIWLQLGSAAVTTPTYTIQWFATNTTSFPVDPSVGNMYFNVFNDPKNNYTPTFQMVTQAQFNALTSASSAANVRRRALVTA